MAGECADLEDYAGTSCAGYLYEAGFIVTEGERFSVVICNGEEDFATLAEAEAYLWREWCESEINN